MIEYAAVIIGSYLIGSIPFGLLLGKLRGVDVRERGSRNIGSTNVLRTVGPWAGAVVLIGDVLKGVTAVFIARYTIGTPYGEMAAAFAAIAGHDWSVFIKFRAGRGRHRYGDSGGIMGPGYSICSVLHLYRGGCCPDYLSASR